MSAQHRCDTCDRRMNAYGAGGTTCADCREGRPVKSGTVLAQWYIEERAALAEVTRDTDPQTGNPRVAA